ncbi:GNAT family N-acetyltransferase [Sinorhizobium medicae]|nr:GNAT family N-acetyltransferase [Sinorhizobium medicae]MDX0430819.1 GNAT family N-acetyltransferase [Sinorhizobium medicae]MDX0444637.1 GNAT family N-acetyltransferase [Sinorhizobium medicae]MDX0494383.1 GNAT family N-acetyltransferase [Sinorhizobium medicae]MDX0539459.1 GNAT family N-acetyltransferase [Sinorhizobium medicae]MDX0570889.1 GNAT family N-acetyltransferase [Sinorhizobium medicae]
MRYHDGYERVLFACLAKSELVGYVSVSRDWNGCAIIDDIAVARPYRRHGIAGELLDHAVMWTRAVGLGAVRLETQSNNVAACRFYQSYGFALGGYDRFLYREIDPEKQDEVALFWYLKLL